jgi:glutamate dehydrogenase/leucine dehydrogenase
MAEPEIHFRTLGELEMIIAIDSTRRGPALGGCRWRNYPDRDAACRDATSLAAAMTRKAALSRLALGGGKAVVIGDPAKRTRRQMRAFGEFVEELGGRYVTAADMGTSAEQMAVFAERTRHVAGLPTGMGGCGDPGPWTARGVLLALQAASAELGLPLEGLHVAIQGLGSVGRALLDLLVERVAHVSVADVTPAALLGLPAEVERVEPERILEVAADVFAPCGPPGVIDAEAAHRLRARIVCGAANNPLSAPRVAAQLEERGILYVPDYLANAGGLIRLAIERDGGDDACVMKHLEVIPANLRRVLDHAKARGIDAGRAADELAASATALDHV